MGKKRWPCSLVKKSCLYRQDCRTSRWFDGLTMSGTAQISELLNPQDKFGFLPELVEFIVIAFRRAEDVNNHVAVVQ